MWDDTTEERMPLVDGVAYRLQYPRSFYRTRVATFLLAPASGSPAAFMFVSGAEFSSAVAVTLPALALGGVAVLLSILLRRASQMPVWVTVRSDGLRIDDIHVPYRALDEVTRGDGELRLVAGRKRFHLLLPGDSDAYDVVHAAWRSCREREEARDLETLESLTTLTRAGRERRERPRLSSVVGVPGERPT